jgi:hypothetical protein
MSTDSIKLQKRSTKDFDDLQDDTETADLSLLNVRIKLEDVRLNFVCALYNHLAMTVICASQIQSYPSRTLIMATMFTLC